MIASDAPIWTQQGRASTYILNFHQMHVMHGKIDRNHGKINCNHGKMMKTLGKS